MTSTYPMDVGPLHFHALNEKGHGVAFHGQREVHVPGILVGEEARIRVLGGGQQRDFGILL